MANSQYFTVKQAAEYLNISERAVQKRCKRDNLMKVNRQFRIDTPTILRWKEEIGDIEIVNKKVKELQQDYSERTLPNEPTNELPNEGDEILTAEFTPDEYAEAMKRIGEYPQLIERLKDYRSEIEYLRKSLDEKAVQMEKAFETMQKSLENVFAALDNQKRDQYLKYQEKKGDL